MKKFGILILLLINYSAIATPLYTLKGKDTSNQQGCQITVLKESKSSSAQSYYAKITTGYRHGGDAHDAITVRPDPTRPRVLIGTGSNNKDLIAIFLSGPEFNLRQAESFNLRWWHHNHFHNNRCVELHL